uniref:S-inosyl-L-homocysteine hydrolase n=1 Tax=Candidatus Methanophaga sp. ANME-1 ERB7 TaxID=2759913 RepID=A0A7G9Z6G3_9EURY|nr:S-inosyl-L-homocysteine hydrolase [Methanosarcinales archaeon ANME-1 ERB7]
MKASIIKNINLAEDGKKRIEWVRGRMPVLDMIRSRYEREKPLENVNVMACLHVTVETANLILTLRAGGAEVALTAANPLSTQDDIAAALASFGVRTYAYRGESDSEYYDYLKYALEIEPTVVLDDGADAITALHTMGEKTRKNVKGTCEETTTGVIRHQARAKENKLGFPVIAVNNAETKMMFDNRYGTGQSTLHGIMNATNILLAGRVLVVGGYGWCGRGVALRAKGLGSNVIVVETNPRKALEAVMDGYRVMPMREASKIGDVFITATGDISVIRGEHFALMKDGVILANTGHFNVELNVNDLEEMAVAKKEIKENVVEYKMKDGRKLYLLSEGRLVNLASAYGHPPEVMDMSFANQALCTRYIVENHDKLQNEVYPVPKAIDEEIARLKLKSMNVEIEVLTEEQKKYLSSWDLGT